MSLEKIIEGTSVKLMLAEHRVNADGSMTVSNAFPVKWCSYSVVDNNGEGMPAILARWPNGKAEIVAVMCNNDHGHDHAEALCELYNERAAQLTTERNAR